MEDKVLEKSLCVLEDVTNKRKIPMEEDGDIIFLKACMPVFKRHQGQTKQRASEI